MGNPPFFNRPPGSRPLTAMDTASVAQLAKGPAVKAAGVRATGRPVQPNGPAGPIAQPVVSGPSVTLTNTAPPAVGTNAGTAGTSSEAARGDHQHADRTTGITAGSAGNASHTVALTWDVYGRLSAAVSTAIALAASAITSGLLALARGGTGADLSTTGGAGQFVKQSTVGGGLTVGVIATADLPGISATIVTAALTLAGTQGSMTFVNGVLTAQTPAT